MAATQTSLELPEEDQSIGYYSECSDYEPSLQSRWHFSCDSLSAKSTSSVSASSEESVISVLSEEEEKNLIDDKEIEVLCARSPILSQNSNDSGYISDTESEKIRRMTEKISSEGSSPLTEKEWFESTTESSKISESDSSIGSQSDSWEVDSDEADLSSQWTSEEDEDWTDSETSDLLCVSKTTSFGRSDSEVELTKSQTSLRLTALRSSSQSDERSQDWDSDSGSEASIKISAKSDLSLSDSSAKSVEKANTPGLDSQYGSEKSVPTSVENMSLDGSSTPLWTTSGFSSTDQRSETKEERVGLHRFLGLIGTLPEEVEDHSKKDLI